MSGDAAGKRRSQLASMAWVGGVFVLLFALTPSRPMSALEQWAYMGPTMLLAALGPVVAKRMFGSDRQRGPEKQAESLDADELEYRAWRRERENPSRGRVCNDIFAGEEFGESWGIVVAIGLLWLIFRAC